MGGVTNSKVLVSYSEATPFDSYPLVAYYNGAHWQRDWVKYIPANGYAVFNMAFSPSGNFLALECEKLDRNAPNAFVAILDS